MEIIASVIIGFCGGVAFGYFFFPAREAPPLPLPPAKRPRRPRVISLSEQELYKREKDND